MSVYPLVRLKSVLDAVNRLPVHVTERWSTVVQGHRLGESLKDVWIKRG